MMKDVSVLPVPENQCPYCVLRRNFVESTLYCPHVIDGFIRCKRCCKVYVEFESESTSTCATLLQVLTFLVNHTDNPEFIYFLENPIHYDKATNWLVFEDAIEPHASSTYHECYVSAAISGNNRSEVNAPPDALVHYTNDKGTFPVTLKYLRDLERDVLIY